MKAPAARIRHPFEPVYDERSDILILGTLPSVKSRENAFYYGHPQNRFWRVLAAVFEADAPGSAEEKTRFLLEHRVALWDVAASCEIAGSSDTSIRRVVPNDLSRILDSCGIRRIYANGKTAGRLYLRYIYPRTGREITVLPSTSPANAAYSPGKLASAWSVIKKDGNP